jgi:hypothetical protein
VHGGQERLGREVLGQAGVAAAGQQVALDVRQRIVVLLQQPERRVGLQLRVRHTLIVAWAADTPTGSAELLPEQGQQSHHVPDDRYGPDVLSRNKPQKYKQAGRLINEGL